jgi:hypothetical protein
MTKTIDDLFIFCSIASDVLLLLLIFLFYRFSKFGKDIKVIAIYTLICLVFGLSVFQLPSSVNFITATVFTFLELSAFYVFLYLNIKSKNWKAAILLSTVAFLVFTITYLILLQSGEIAKPKGIDSIPIGIETILVLIFAFYYFFEQTNDISSSYIYSRYHFWFVLGFTIYLSGSFFIYIFASQVDRATLLQYWFITNIFYILKNILFIVGIQVYIKGKRTPLSQSNNYSPFLN